jgi:hypothetical protein
VSAAVEDSMAEAHERLRIRPEHVDLVVGHLVEALAGLGVPGPTIQQIGATLAPLKADSAPERPEDRTPAPASS